MFLYILAVKRQCALTKVGIQSYFQHTQLRLHLVLSALLSATKSPHHFRMHAGLFIIQSLIFVDGCRAVTSLHCIPNTWLTNDYTEN